MLPENVIALTREDDLDDTRGETPAPQAGGAPKRGGGEAAAKKKRPVNFGDYTRLMERFALIYGTDTAWDGENMRIVKVGAMRLAFGDAVKMWLGSNQRRMVMPEQIVFEPSGVLPPGGINLFDGFPIKPVPATAEDVAPMLDLLHHLCRNSAGTDEGVGLVMAWVLRWLAYPFQRPGAKLRTALVFHGPQGTGKNLFFDVVRACYGRYGVMVGQTELEDKFNDWLSAKQLIIANEVVTRTELYHHKNKLKWIITEDNIPIRAMQQSVRWERNHAQVVFLSNEQQPLALEEGDRRYVVIYTPIAEDTGLYARVAKFLEAGGAAKFLGYLMALDLGDFSEHTKPIMTQAKADLIDIGLRPAERFAKEWLGGLLPLPVQVCSAEQLYRCFRRWCDLTGERFPPPQPMFTKQAERYVIEQCERGPDGALLPPRLNYRVVALANDVGARRAVRCWLPSGTGPLPGVTVGEWANESVESFEAHVRRFGRGHLDEAAA